MEECACSLAAAPTPRPVCSANQPPQVNQEHISVDAIYLQTKPFLHVIDNCSRWSETGLLRTRRLCDQIDMLKRIQLFKHGITRSIRADQEYNKDEFLKFCEEYDIELTTIAANHHEDNAHVERANRSIRSYFDRLVITEPRSALIDLVAAATFFINTCRGHKKSSAFELLYNRVPNLSTVCNPLAHGSTQDNAIEFRSRQLQNSLNAKTRRKIAFALGHSVFIWRDNSGWVGPAIVVKLNEHSVEVLHNGRTKSSDQHKTRVAPSEPRSLPPRLLANCGPSDDEDTEAEEIHTTPDEAQPTTTTPSSRPYQRRTEAQRLIAQNQRLIADIPEKRHSRNTHQTSFMTSSTRADGTTCPQGKLTEDEKRHAYKLEKLSWIDAKAFDRVPKKSTPHSSNIIGSHVVYRHKPDGTPKARIVPWGHEDLGKDQIRGDAPTLNLDSMRLLFSLAAEHRWVVRKMDVKSAYLQAIELSPEVLVRPPKEENDGEALWRLLVPAYGLTDSGCLWYMTLHEALTRRFWFAQSLLDPSMYMYEGGSERLILVAQVEGYLYAGSSELASKFEQFLQNHFHIGSTEAKSFNMMGACLVQDESAKITIDAKDKPNQIQPLAVGTSKDKDLPATEKEQTAYQSIIGKLLYIGRLTSPVISFHASQASTKCLDLCLHHLKSLNAALRVIQKCPCIITYLPGEEGKFTLEAMSDGLMLTTNEKTNVREGIILFRRNGEILHPIGWTSTLARRVARSTSTAELLSAADATDKLTFFKHLTQENLGTKSEKTELILDSRSAFYLCPTLKEPEEIKNKLLLASIREEYHKDSMAAIRWTPGSTHLADALTKDNREIAGQLDNVLKSGMHRHPDTSYVGTSDVQGPNHYDDKAVGLPITHSTSGQEDARLSCHTA